MGLPRAARVIALALVAGGILAPVAAAEPFPAVRPASRAQAAAVLSAGMPLEIPCLTPLLAPGRAAEAPLPVRRALRLLQVDAPLPGEARHVAPDGTVVRWTTEGTSFDRTDPADLDANGLPDAVDAAVEGVAEARDLWSGDLEIAVPATFEVLLAEPGAGFEGYTVPLASGRVLVVLDPTPAGGPEDLRAQAAHQAAHVTLRGLGPVFPGPWAEALATWTEVALAGSNPGPRLAALLSGRLERLAGGLLDEGLADSAGNALWAAWLAEAHGPLALRLSVQEMAAGQPPAAAFDRALRRAAGETLTSALREFHVWTVLTGSRDDGRHFSFGSRLRGPALGSDTAGLPAVSVLAEPAVGPLGLAVARLRPERAAGGIALRFEGEATGRWQADLLLVGTDGSRRLVPLAPGPDGSGEATLPLDGLAEMLLLVRNIETDQAPPRTYAWTAHEEPGFPYELVSAFARPAEGGGMEIDWETRGERQVVGFNILRYREGGAPVRVNPIWIPSVGEPGVPGAYRFLDPEVRPGEAVTWRVEAITTLGLPSRSEAIVPSLR